MLRRVVCIVALILTTATLVHAENWPQWRGPNRDGISHGCDSSGVLACRARERCDPGTYSLAEYQARSAAGHTLRAGPRLPQPRSRIAPRSQNGRVTPPSVALVGIHSATPRRRVILAVLRLASIGNSITGSVLWKLDSQI